MRGPAVNLVVLGLVVLFVGLQHHGRPSARTRLWFAGWVCLFLSMVLWEFQPPPSVVDRLREMARFDFILLAQLLFVVSMVASAPGLWRVVLRGSLLGVPAVIVLNSSIKGSMPAPVTGSMAVALLVMTVVLWQVNGVYAMQRLIPEHWRIHRLLILCICVVYGAAFVAHLLTAQNRDLQDWVLAELTLSSAVLYCAESERRTFAGYMGMLGFLMWASFYLLSGGTELTLLPGYLHWVGVFWDVPKILVGASMVLRMAEDARNEKEQLAKHYRDLYEDFHMLYEEHPHPIWLYDPQTGVLLTANRAAEVIYGYTATELVGMHMDTLEMVRDADSQAVDAILPPLAEGRRSRHRRSDGTLMWMNVYERDVIFQGRPARAVLTRDITAQLMNSLELAHRAHHDALTGLPNRHQLDDRIDACLARCERENRMAALLSIDVDHFKQINDTYGHHVGDECLKAVAARLQSRIRQGDTLARSGGEEFTAIIGALHSVADAYKIASTLLGIFAAPIGIPDLEIFITISIGVALFPDDSSDRETLKQQSDDALYEAKRLGRNRFAFAAPRRDPRLLSGGVEGLPVV